MTESKGWLDPNDPFMEKWDLLQAERKSNFHKFRCLSGATKLYMDYLKEEEKTRPMTDEDYEIVYQLDALEKKVKEKLDYPRSEAGFLPLLRHLDKKLKEKIAEEEEKANG